MTTEIAGRIPPRASKLPRGLANRRRGSAWLVLVLAACRPGAREPAASPAASDPAAAVDPFIGTGGGGFGQPQAFVGAAVPFGLAKPGPDTEGPLLADLGFAHAAGYWWYDDTVDGFSLLHMHGTGIEDYGNFPLMPVLGMSDAKTGKDGYKQKFSHDTEVASPGYYAVTLSNTEIRVELTAGERVAIERFTFPAGSRAPTIVLDASRQIGKNNAMAAVTVAGSWNEFADMVCGCRPRAAKLDAVDDRLIRTPDFGAVISATAINAGRFTGDDRAFPLYLVAIVDPLPATWGTFQGGRIQPGAPAAAGTRAGAYMTFADGTTIVEVHAAVSLRNSPDALGVQTEELIVAGRDFDKLRAAAGATWRSALAAATVYGATTDDRRIFYTALYHALLMPTIVSDFSGAYVGLDRKVHQDGGIAFHTDMSLWDTYRTLNPLLALLAPRRAVEIAQSLVRMAQQYGAPPRWPLGVNETGTMIGSPAAIVWADTARKSAVDPALRGWDQDAAFAAALSDARGVTGHTIRGGDATVCAAGWCPADRVGGSVSRTLEYDWADWAIAGWAAQRGDVAIAGEFTARAQGWRRLWDPATKFLRGRSSDGTFAAQFDPLAWGGDYVEGDAWQYLWEEPWDAAGLIAVFGSADAMLQKLDEFFTTSAATPPVYLLENQRDHDRYYWHGNEPDIHAAYLYALAGAGARGAKWIDWVRRKKYGTGPDGLDGNDDAGTLSAWFVWSSLGLYPLAGSDLYVLGLPLWPRAVLHLAGGDVEITLSGAGADYAAERRDRTVATAMPQIEAITIDGRPITAPWITHAQLLAAKRIDFRLTAAR